eukprot:scaffold306443_cov26-Tisochrysis_lutea.AAC.4
MNVPETRQARVVRRKAKHPKWNWGGKGGRASPLELGEVGGVHRFELLPQLPHLILLHTCKLRRRLRLRAEVQLA